MRPSVRVIATEWVSFFHPQVDNGYRKDPVAILTVQCFLPKIDWTPLSPAHYQVLAPHTEVPSGLCFLPRWFCLVWWGEDEGRREGKSVYICVFMWMGRIWKIAGICRSTAWRDDCGASSPFILSLLFLHSSLTFFFLLPSNLSLSFLRPVSLYHFLLPPLSLSVSLSFSLFSQIRPVELQAAGLVNWNGRVSRPGQWALCFLPKHLQAPRQSHACYWVHTHLHSQT